MATGTLPYPHLWWWRCCVTPPESTVWPWSSSQWPRSSGWTETPQYETQHHRAAGECPHSLPSLLMSYCLEVLWEPFGGAQVTTQSAVLDWSGCHANSVIGSKGIVPIQPVRVCCHLTATMQWSSNNGSLKACWYSAITKAIQPCTV